MADTYDIEVNQACSLNLIINVKDESGNALNLSGYTPSGRVKETYGNTGIMLDLAPSVYSAASGQLQISIPASGVAALPVGSFVYDIFLVSGLLTELAVEGDFNVNPTVFSI